MIKPNRIAIIGPGAIGCLFAGLLSGNGGDVWLLDRDRARAKVIDLEGVKIDDSSGTMACPVRCTSKIRDIGRVRLVLVCVKAHDTFSAAMRIKSLVADGGTVVSVQNGAGNVERLSGVLPADMLVGCATGQGATLIEPGHVRHAGAGPTFVASYVHSAGHRAVAVADAFSAHSIPTTVADSFNGMIWGKLVLNAAINAVAAGAGVANGGIVADASLWKTASAAAREAASVARAKGIILPFSDEADQVRLACAATSGNICSMLQDIRAGKTTEIDAINGVVVREAQKLGMEVPVNELLVKNIGKLKS